MDGKDEHGISCDRVPDDVRQLICALSGTVCERLPRELRDLVYAFILDDKTLHRVHDCAFPFGTRGSQPIAITHDVDPKYWPICLMPTAVNETFRTELVEYFCKVDRYLRIKSGQDLQALLTKDILRSGISHADRPLHFLELNTSFRIEMGYSLDPEALTKSLSPIIQGHQKLANTFTLNLDIPATYYSPKQLSDDHHNASMSRLLGETMLSLRNADPTLKKVREIIEKEGTERKMHIIIGVIGIDEGPRLNFLVQENVLEVDMDQWLAVIKNVLKNKYGIE